MSWHYYCELFDAGNDNTTVSSILVQFFCDVLFGPDVFNTVKLRTEEIGGGSMLTEVRVNFRGKAEIQFCQK